MMWLSVGDGHIIGMVWSSIIVVWGGVSTSIVQSPASLRLSTFMVAESSL